MKSAGIPSFCACDGGIDPPQVHIRSNDEGAVLVDGVPRGIILRRRAVSRAQHQLCKLHAVVRNSHNLKLTRACFITGEQMDGIVKSPIGFAVSDQLGIPLFITRLEFLYDVSVGSSGKRKARCVSLPKLV